MMRLEDQVTSLALSKKLKEIGINQESLFYWQYEDEHCHGIIYAPYCVVPDDYNRFKLYSAFTASELFQFLPYYIDTDNNHPFNGFRFKMKMCSIVENENIERNFLINYECDTADHNLGHTMFFRGLFNHAIRDKNLANCLAKTIIYLIENKLIGTDHKTCPPNCQYGRLITPGQLEYSTCPICDGKDELEYK